MILQIQKGENNPVLRKKTQTIDKIDEGILQLVKDMIETMNKNSGVGLSANQIGRNIRLFVVHPNLSKKTVFINPKIYKASKKKIISEEGCLSVPGVYKKLQRAKSLKIEAVDENDKQFKLKAKDLLARVIQHELDHLNGILIIDKNE
ncbi:MAG: peptide deformylase [Candidatus Portnoybacteria bacterium RBG_13_40_8]|uniref:Peptide deformylase n=1 Tax=Candidatus Portnoybacteria bacterium RBG_13_40_8 TaxID=1801990 RepID=A0A1G2F580_9BACT|nr:MAG: peptide deformylase [Candidatus Portnoybacteria bacterium RBG_13_40_8]OGZ34515.1 MAG: peptide deformylase [Candidatus Portnoybacteria bacterium RIFCSPHIGHO2_01_FULL_39_19]